MRRRTDPRTTNPDDLRELRAFRAEDAAPDADARAAARLALLELIEAEQGAAGPRPAAPRARRVRRRLFAGGLGLATCLAATLALVLGSGGVRPERARASAAAAALNAAAIVAADSRADVTLGAGEYWYVRSERVEPFRIWTYGGVTFRLADVHTRNETWVDAAGGQRIVSDVIGDPQFATPADRRAWIEAGRPTLGLHQDLRIAPAVLTGVRGLRTVTPSTDGWTTLVGMTYKRLRALPGNDDRALVAQLTASVAGAPGGPFALAADLLRKAPLRPAQRAALYRVMAKTPGTTLQGTVHDLHGRSGTGITLVTNGLRVTLIFDPRTAALLDVDHEVTDVAELLAAQDPVFSDDPATVKGVLGYHEGLLASGVVGSTHSRP